MKIIDPELSLRDVPTRGPSDNLRKLASGELDLGLVSGEVLHEALEGITYASGVSRPLTEWWRGRQERAIGVERAYSK